MSHLGIIVAVTAEARSLTRESIRKDKRIRLRDGAFVSVSGVGPKRAASASRILLEEGATALLSWGSAGGLSPKLLPGSLILPKTIMASDHSLYQVDAGWHDRLCNRLRGHIDFCTDPLTESAAVVCTPGEKADLFRRTGAAGVDMESAAVATVAGKARVPFIAVRAVADAMNTTLPASTLNAFDEFGRLRLFRLILGLAGYPAEFPAIVRMARSYRAAQKTLTAVARLTENDLFDSRDTAKERPRKP